MMGVGVLPWVLVGWCCWGAGVEGSQEVEAEGSELRAAVVLNQLVLEHVANLLMDVVNTSHHQPHTCTSHDDGDPVSARRLAFVLDPQDAVHNLTQTVAHTFDQFQDVTDLMKQTLDRLLEVTEGFIAIQNDVQARNRDTTLLQEGLGVAKECPAPFFRANAECFYVHQAHPMTWHEATNFCRRLGGDLAEPITVEFLIAVLFQRPEVPQKKYWIGGSDVHDEGRWKWTSDRRIDLRQVAWMPGEPNNSGQEDCLVLRFDRYPALNDGRCGDKIHFVCEHPMNA